LAPDTRRQAQTDFSFSPDDIVRGKGKIFIILNPNLFDLENAYDTKLKVFSLAFGDAPFGPALSRGQKVCVCLRLSAAKHNQFHMRIHG
jgi:hypothetical protein